MAAHAVELGVRRGPGVEAHHRDPHGAVADELRQVARQRLCVDAGWLLPLVDDAAHDGVTLNVRLSPSSVGTDRLGVPATVRNLRIVEGAWGYGPINVRCSVVSSWEAAIVRLDGEGQVAATVRAQSCNTEDGR